jgi:hypothetical protein
VHDLDGGVCKKPLNRNLDRSIILSRSRKHWIYAYLFSKRRAFEAILSAAFDQKWEVGDNAPCGMAGKMLYVIGKLGLNALA